MFEFSCTATAQVELDRFFPPAITAGSTSVAKAEGKFPQWPVRFECDHPNLTIACTENSGEFRITSTSPVPGAAWIRLFDDQAATSLVPLLIESNAIVQETEPNESLKLAPQINSPTTAIGKLQKNGDVDVWKIPLRSGEQLVATLIAHELLQSPMDAVLQLVDYRGLVLAQAEDSIGLDPQLVFTAAQEGDYFVRVFGFPETPTGTIGFAGGANFVYALRLTTGAYLDHCLPLHSDPDKLNPIAFGFNLSSDLALLSNPATATAPAVVYSPKATGWQWLPPSRPSANLTFASEQTTAPENGYELPLQFAGHIAINGEIDRVRIQTKAGTNYRAKIVSRAFGYKLDSVLQVFKLEDRTPIARNDDSIRDDRDAAVEFKSDTEQTLTLAISDLADSSSPRHAYELLVEPVTPHASTTLATDHLRVLVGKEIEVSVAIDRQFGFSSRLEIAATRLPTGVSAAKVISEPKGDSAKSVKLKLVAAADAPPFQGPIEFTATPVDDKQSPIAEPQRIYFPLRPQIELKNIWLTVASDKPNKANSP